MARAWLVLAIVTGVVSPAAAKPAANESSGSEQKSVTKKQTKKSSKSKKSKKKSKRSGAASARLPEGKLRGARADNMPRGFTWPPSEQMLEAEKACEARLDAAGVVWKRADRDGRMVDAITIEHMTLGGIAFSNAWGGKGPYKLQ
jgi:hypothetical protein